MTDDHDYMNERFRWYYIALIERLKMLSGKEGPQAIMFAEDVCRSVLGAALDLEAYADLDGDQAWDLLLRVEGVLTAVDLIAMVFLVEKLKMLGGRTGWGALQFVDDVCRSALDRRQPQPRRDPKDRAGRHPAPAQRRSVADSRLKISPAP